MIRSNMHLNHGKLAPTATQYLPTVKSLTERHWAQIIQTCSEVLEAGNKRKKPAKSMSLRASSEVVDEEDYTQMLVSEKN